MSQQKGGSFVRDKLAGDVLAFVSHSRYRYVRERSGVAAASSASFRISDLVISREKLSRLMEQFIYIYIYPNTSNFTLYTRATFSRASTFLEEERRKAKEELVLFVQGQNSWHRFDRFQRSELGLRDRTAEERTGGSSSLFATF